MSLPTSVRQLRPGDTIGATDRPLARHRNEVGNVIVVGIVILLGEFVVEYGGYTILFAVTLDLVHEAVEDIADVLRLRDQADEDCEREFASCMLTETADRYGSVHGSRRCLWCKEACLRNGGNWPSRAPATVGTVSCDYWRRN
jgi:hypothetical protein